MIRVTKKDKQNHILVSKSQLSRSASTDLPTSFGVFKMIVYKTSDKTEHVAMIKGDIRQIPLVRLHSSCLTGDIFFSLKCDCGEQLKLSFEQIKRNGSGIILYLNQEGRGIGLTNKIKAYALQQKGHDTVEANKLLGLPIDARDYKIAADILTDLGIKKIRLLTNNPDKIQQLIQNGINIVEQVPLETQPNEINKSYLKTKKQKMSHKLSFV